MNLKIKAIALEVLKPVNILVNHQTLKLKPQDRVELPLEEARDLIRAGYAKAASPLLVEAPDLTEGR